MKSREIKVVSQPLLPLLPSFVQKGMMVYSVSSSGLLKGLYFEDSSFDKDAFYVWAFYLPLYVPASHISFTFGKRLASGKRWKMEAGKSAAITEELTKAVRDEAVPFFGKADTPERFAKSITEIAGNARDPYVLQGRAYSLVKAGNVSAAVGLLAELIAVLKGMDAKIAWVGEMLGRAEKLLHLVTEDGAAAKQLLVDWEASSRMSLRLNGSK
jgi:hypothetical protein